MEYKSKEIENLGGINNIRTQGLFSQCICSESPVFVCLPQNVIRKIKLQRMLDYVITLMTGPAYYNQLLNAYQVF